MAFLSDYSTNDVPTATEMNVYFTGEGGPWRTYTPVVYQGAARLTSSTQVGLYAQHGRLTIVSVGLTITDATFAAAGFRVFVTLPSATDSVVASPAVDELIVGPARVLSGGVITGEEYVAVTQDDDVFGDDVVAFHYQGIGSGRDYYLGDDYSFAMDEGYTITFSGFYQAAANPAIPS